MITAKLYTYSTEEVDYLRVLIDKDCNNIREIAPCHNLKRCNPNCQYRHLCNDLSSLVFYLYDEKENGYKHLRNK